MKACSRQLSRWNVISMCLLGRCSLLGTSLYGLAAITTAIQLRSLMSDVIRFSGVPPSPIQYVALAGSGLLGVAAVLAWRQRRRSLAVAVCGAVLLWAFYGRLLLSGWKILVSSHFNLDFVTNIGPLAFLTIATIYACSQAVKWMTVRQRTTTQPIS